MPLSRADAVVNFAMAFSLIAPFCAWISFRFAARGRLTLHRNLQVALLVLGTAAVLALEVDIRLSGGSLALLSKSASGRTGRARVLLGVHIIGAVATYVAWAVQAVKAYRRFGTALPGGYSPNHRRVGRWVFAGLCFTAVSAGAVYAIAFLG